MHACTQREREREREREKERKREKEREKERKKEMMIGRAIELATYPVTTDRRLCQMNRLEDRYIIQQ